MSYADWCWACDARTDDPGPDCEDCGAPYWPYSVSRVQLADGPGVYIVQAACGMHKIGMSKKSMVDRVRSLDRQTPGGVTVRASLPHAGYRVEAWLHDAFACTRDRGWAAHCEGLPNATEWFWPEPALEALIAGQLFLHLLEPEVIDPMMKHEREAA